MSDCSTPTETPSSGEQEPTMVSVPVVGSSASDNMATSWNSGETLGLHESCNLSSLCNSGSTSPANAAQLTSAICSAEIVSHDNSPSTPFMHSGIVHDADSTSESLEDRMMEDGSLQTTLSVHAIVTQESMSASQESENSEDHLSVVDNITAQNFLQESDLMNAASSALGHKKEADEELDKSDLHHNLLSLEHQSVSSTQDQIESLLQEQQDLDGQVSSITDYHLDHSQASELSVGSTSQLDIGGTLPEGVTADGVCLSPSSNSSTSSLDLPGGVSISSGIGLPPVSTIIRSSAKGRFDVFCRPSNISMIMDIPQFLGNNNSFDAMTSMNSIQRLTSSPCDSLSNVSLASPMEVSSSRHNTCTDVVMESVDVPLSSSLVCSSTAISHCASIVESRCIKANTVMSSLGPVMLQKHALSEMTDSQLESETNLNLPITSTSSIPNFINVPLREIMHISTSPSQVSQHLSPMAIEEMQKVAEINEHLRSGVGTPYTLHSSDESIAMLSPHFSVADGIQHSDNYVDVVSQRSQPASVSAIETNVIMSTSNIDSSPKFSVAEIKAIEQRLRTEHSRSARNVNHEMEGAALNSEVIIPDCIETNQSSDIIYSNVQNALDDDAETRKILKAHNIMRSTIIEKNLLQSQVIKNESSVITSPEGTPSNNAAGVGAAQSNNGDIVTIKTNKKLALSHGRQDSMPNVSPSAVTASVIQQLLRAQSPPSKLRSTLQHIPRGVITSVMSSKGDSMEHQEILISSSPAESSSGNMKKEMRETDISVTAANILQNSNLMDTLDSSKDKSITVTIGIPEHSVISRSSKSPSPLGDKDAGLPHLNSTVLPSLFSNLSASALASLQSSLSSALPLTIQSSLPNISLGESTSTASISPVLSSPPLSPILLPNILPATLRTAGIKPGDIAVSTNCVTSSTGGTNHLYSGLLKTVGLSGVKQEPGSGPLPPFTVVSGLVKREFGATLASNLIGASGAQIPVVTIKQEPGVTRAQASASEFGPSIVLSAGTALPGIASIRLPNAAAVQLPVVVATTAAPELASNPAVPSQASTIAFAVSTSSVADHSAREAEDSDKADDCPMCKNGSPCGLHPTTQPRVARAATAPAPPPPQPVLSGDPAKPFRCTLCGKHLASKNVYQLHLRSHSGEKPFTCNLCGHHFSQKTSLTRHMRSHTGERPFPCDVCGKRFADKERIKIHMRTHTGEKPFACEVCGKRFSQKSTVKRHMSVHTGEKPFKCESCGKGFANRGNLNAHSKTHANT
ncbi:uncharacterized protein LOC129222578 [Uloborus diversus]|uniref:uncharacterized protein LOC129222578 n=1 Tax=Uloborus diversus TaxID=327109 RepID=UPI002409DC00|nr:uncharacterized protein LOC129222578 [Uloborus diversus]